MLNEQQKQKKQIDYSIQREYATKGELSRELAEEIENDILVEQIAKDLGSKKKEIEA